MKILNRQRSFHFIWVLNLILVEKAPAFVNLKCHPTTTLQLNTKRSLIISSQVDPNQEEVVSLIVSLENTADTKKSGKRKAVRKTTQSTTSRTRQTKAKGSPSATRKLDKSKKASNAKVKAASRTKGARPSRKGPTSDKMSSEAKISQTTKSFVLNKTKRTARAKGTNTKAISKVSIAAKKSINSKTLKDPSHWVENSDEVIVQHHDGDDKRRVSELRFKVRGNPRPLVRHRSRYGNIYNPSAKLQETFRKAVQDLVFFDNDLQPPIFEADEFLVMTILFRLKRPKAHFINGKPGPERLRESAPSQTSSRVDVDNLTKFVLDSMNEVLYQDDRQIVSIHVTKILDNEGMCQGSTEVYLRSIEEEAMETLINNAFQNSK